MFLTLLILPISSLSVQTVGFVIEPQVFIIHSLNKFDTLLIEIIEIILCKGLVYVWEGLLERLVKDLIAIPTAIKMENVTR